MLHYEIKQLCDKRITCETITARENIDKAIDEVCEAIGLHRAHTLTINKFSVEVAYGTYKNTYYLF